MRAKSVAARCSKLMSWDFKSQRNLTRSYHQCLMIAAPIVHGRMPVIEESHNWSCNWSCHISYVINIGGATIGHTLSKILTVCFRYGIVPDSSTKGLLIPLLKKPSDPTTPKNYIPIVISTTISKLIEIHILQKCGEHEFHDFQFGFVPNRSTTMAAALTHDVLITA